MASVYTREQLREDQLAGLFMAAAFTMLAGIGFGLAVMANFVQMMRGHSLEVPWSTLGAVALVVVGSYVVAGQLGAFAFFLLRPLRPSLLGWMLTGFWIAFLAYGSVGVALAAFYDPVGRVFLDDSTAAEAWELVRLTPWLGAFGALAGAWHWWFNIRHASAPASS